MVNRLSHPTCTRNIIWDHVTWGQCVPGLRPWTHYPHVTWAHVMLRVQLGCERRFTTEFYGADSHFCHSAQVTWSHVPARFSHLLSHTLREVSSRDMSSRDVRIVCLRPHSHMCSTICLPSLHSESLDFAVPICYFHIYRFCVTLAKCV
jgi:hypothetical protein